MGELAVLPPHETIIAMIEEGLENKLCDFDETHANFKPDLEAWAAKLGIILSGFWGALAFWGDSTPSMKKTVYIYLRCPCSRVKFEIGGGSQRSTKILSAIAGVGADALSTTFGL